MANYDRRGRQISMCELICPCIDRRVHPLRAVTDKRESVVAAGHWPFQIKGPSRRLAFSTAINFQTYDVGGGSRGDEGGFNFDGVGHDQGPTQTVGIE